MYGFYLTDLGLYLDTHSSDKEALRLFNETRDKYYKKVVDFEKMYYPLNSDGSYEMDMYCELTPEKLQSFTIEN